MARKTRVDIADNYYHCINRANSRSKINFTQKDYLLFLDTLSEAQEIFQTEILAFVVMPNHFHLVIRTRYDKEMSQFMRWLTLTHTQRWHTIKETSGTGHLYQGRYKSFLITNQEHLEIVLRYVERNPLTANLIKNVLNWKYSSLYQRYRKSEIKIKLTQWPHGEYSDYLSKIIEPLSLKEIKRAGEIE